MNYEALHELLSPSLLILSEHFPLEEKYREALTDYVILVHPLFQEVYVDHATAALANVETEAIRILKLIDSYHELLPDDEDLSVIRLHPLFHCDHEAARLEAERLLSTISTQSARDMLNEYIETVNDFAASLTKSDD